MIKKRYTKWIPLGGFTFGNNEYVTFVRKNIKTGMLRFKTKQVNGWFGSMGCTNPFMPDNIIDTAKAWEEITNK